MYQGTAGRSWVQIHHVKFKRWFRESNTISAGICDFQQYGILACVDSEEFQQPPF